MCEIFVKADPHLYECRARSIRLHGAVTSIRLENLFWHALEEIATRDGMSVNQLITKLYDELVEYRGEIDNFTSFLRVCCLRYLSLMVDGAISTDKRIPLAGAKLMTGGAPTMNNGTNMVLMQSR
ncbi:ribbon-helix-helix domain-containing protein [Herbaspirillum sp. ST 5-3]|uniref:ribbon-helix-helix domain-containing protein n=1 Tax=Oxalobacteraceae TaxID=75682 RepID=UPI0010A523AF|nr:ribbon-helix-helix domain-containing protein [Herbaspirillum sp. ST 5-3]